MDLAHFRRLALVTLGALFLCMVMVPFHAAAQPPVPLDPNTISKYVTALVIPPVMPESIGDPDADYNVAVRQFKQQILPGTFPPTTVWSYGRYEDPLPQGGIAPRPVSEGSSFNYPALTFEVQRNKLVKVRWINDLVDANGNYLPHLLGPVVDQTLHWANPPQQDCMMGPPRPDCRTMNPDPYLGPVPIVTHVHGAHVGPESDGYPEAWWLPAANNIPVEYAMHGTLFDQYGPNSWPGSALFGYPNDQRAATVWYHDHTLGMTRLNVYAGPAGFWLIRGNSSQNEPPEPDVVSGTLPGPASVAGEDPNFDAVVRAKIREIPIAIQDRSFYTDGSLFYPLDRAFFEGLTPAMLNINFIPDSDISPIWNPEAFFNTIVVNGNTWPFINVEAQRYRFRLLNGCNSRFLNLSIFEVLNPGTSGETLGAELPIYVIGAEGGLLPYVVKVLSGVYTVYDGTPGGTTVQAPDPQQALLMALAERADVIVDFTGQTGKTFRMINTAPDAPFGGFPDTPADPATTGQVMQFVVMAASAPDPSTPADQLVFAPRQNLTPDRPARQVSLNEEESSQVCVHILPDGSIEQIDTVLPGPNFLSDCAAAGGEPFAPKAALVGTVDLSNPSIPLGIPLNWTDNTGVSAPTWVYLADGTPHSVKVTENPMEGDTEVWEIYNFTMDAHPIHLHLVQYQVVGRTMMDGSPSPNALQPWETGWKDTVIAYPQEITRVKARFDVTGLFVWHCHIVEHEDNEMMRPYIVIPFGDVSKNGCVDREDYDLVYAEVRAHGNNLWYDLNKDGRVTIADARVVVLNYTNPGGASCP